MGSLTGSVKQLHGGEWQLCANLPPAFVDGHRRYPRRYKTVPLDEGRKTKAKREKEGQAKLYEWLAELEQERCTDPDRLTFKAMTDRWLAAMKLEIRPATLDFYESNMERHVLPTLGHRIAAEVGRADIMELCAAKGDTMAPGSVKHIRATIRAAYSWAIEEAELLDANRTNPATKSRRRQRGKRERRARTQEYRTWNDDQIATAATLARGRLVHLPLLLAGWCGLRRGEVWGLRFEDVSFDARKLTVRWSLEQVGSKLHDQPPKTGEERDVHLTDAVFAALEERHALDAGKRLADRGWNPTGYVITTGKGTPIKPRNLSSASSDFCKRERLERIRFHDLRHSYVTIMRLKQGESVQVVGELVGHKNGSMTEAYTHPDDKMHKRAVMRQNRRVAAALAKAEQVSRLVRDNVRPLRKAVG